MLITMAAPSRRPGNLPAEATSFIGRRRELAEVRKKLSLTRIVTLVGPGGVGKTRLATRLATDLSRSFKDGAWLVELADVQDARLVSKAVMTALTLRDQAASDPLDLLRLYLQDKALLLVIDNCERVLEAVASVATEIIRTAPSVRLITTSREPLSITGEHVVTISPFPLPSAEKTEPVAQVAFNEAVMLFTERATAASGNFEFRASNQAAVVEICRRLDGLPLAIELAAVRTRLLTAEQIRDRLDDRFRLLRAGPRDSAPRHQTLRGVIDWSHELLSPEERLVFRRLSVFGGRTRLEDIEAVCGADDMPAERIFEILSGLVDKSLVIKEDVQSRACYRLHETMREYAHLKLDESGEEEPVGESTADYYLDACRRSAEEVGFRRLDWLQWMDVEIDNVRALLQRCLVRADVVRGLAIAGSLGWYWMTRATTEGVRWLDELLALGAGEPLAQARACFTRGYLATLQGDPATALTFIQRAEVASRQAGDRRLLCQSLAVASVIERMSGHPGASEKLLDEVRTIAAVLMDPEATLALLQAQSFNGLLTGDLEAVVAASSDGVRLSRIGQDLYTLETWLVNLGLARLLAGDHRAATDILEEGLRTSRTIDDRLGQGSLLAALGCVAAASGRAEQATRLLGAAESVRIETGASVNPILAPLLTRAEASARATLGESKFETQLKAGRQLERQAAIALGLGEGTRPVPPERNGSKIGLLGRREAEIAGLVAQGLSNKQIGARLFISERTVEGHVRNLLNKFGFDSRAQIAGWVASNQ